jgi:adenylosuccinate synthase
MINFAHVIVDLQAGDTGKGKVAHSLCRNPDKYTHVVRYNGGGNAGHTFYHNGEKFVTHYIPVGVMYGIKSIIGPGCVVNLRDLDKEIEELESRGVKVKENLFIDKRTHIIQDSHIQEDFGETKIGTTKKGNGPAYRDKYARSGLRAGLVLSESIIDIYEELHGEKECRILFEGAQGFELDIDWGDYPYVTSSHCTVGGAIINGVPPQKIETIFGIAKAYRTYVGSKDFEDPCPIFDRIREIGNEYGATTGRKRQIAWLDLDDLIKASRINGVTDLIINKLDVLSEAGDLSLISKGNLIRLDTIEEFMEFCESRIRSSCDTIKTITFSMSPLEI